MQLAGRDCRGRSDADFAAASSAPIAVFLVEKARAHSCGNHCAARDFPGGLIEDEVANAYFGHALSMAMVVIDFAVADAEAPFMSVNDELWVEIEADLERQLREQTGAVEFPAQVEAAIRRALNVGPVRVEAICEELGVSRSTMQRQLAAEGQAYQSILNHVRRDLAERYLTKSTLTPVQVAGLMGFADPKSFQRAFKKWTGKPPESFARSRRPERAATVGRPALAFRQVPSAAQRAIGPHGRGEHRALALAISERAAINCRCVSSRVSWLSSPCSNRSLAKPKLRSRSARTTSRTASRRCAKT